MTGSTSGIGFAIAAGPAEAGAMVVHLTSEQASATTGAALRVDGGVPRAIP